MSYLSFSYKSYFEPFHFFDFISDSRNLPLALTNAARSQKINYKNMRHFIISFYLYWEQVNQVCYSRVFTYDAAMS